MILGRRPDQGPGGISQGNHVTIPFLWWLGMRGMLNRSYVLLSGLYFVVSAHLTASQLVLLGTSTSLALLLANIPVGVWADAFSRKWLLALGQLVLAAAMVLTGLVTAFPVLVLTQVVWRLGWACLVGADVAWLNDELNDPQRVARVLAASARWGITGRVIGTLAFGLLGWATSLPTAIVVSGIAMALLAVFVATRFPERFFVPARTPQPWQWWEAAFSIFQRGIRLARRDRDIRVVFVATLLLNGAIAVAWVFPKQLITLGFPNDPILWYTAIGVFSAALGVGALSLVEQRIDGVGVARRFYSLACFVGVLGLLLLAVAPNALIGGVGVLLLNGTAATVPGPVSVIWVNRRTTSDVRATVQSFLAQTDTVSHHTVGVWHPATSGTCHGSAERLHSSVTRRSLSSSDCSLQAARLRAPLLPPRLRAERIVCSSRWWQAAWQTPR
jgi:MFS family permease